MSIRSVSRKQTESFFFSSLVATNPLELGSLARTILIQRPCDGSEEVLHQICPNCLPMVVVRRGSSELKTVDQ